MPQYDVLIADVARWGHLRKTYLQVGASVEQLPRGAGSVELSVLDEQRHGVTSGGLS